MGAYGEWSGLCRSGTSMRTSSASAVSSLTPTRDVAGAHWRERSGRLFREFERPAKAMVRRAFRGAFAPDEIDDIYSGAWVGVLRALAARERELDDDEVRSYVLTAVANQASRELRRRRRKPTAPLELVGGVADQAATPEDVVVTSERSRLTRDLLASLPPRRRAVMLLRYGWGLEPAQVCKLVAGLSSRAYRKEVTRGVDELIEKMRTVERGEWCADREPVLKAYVAGLASPDQQRQAKAHLAHCRSCSGFVARLSGHLHDLGGSVAATTTLAALRTHAGFGDRALVVIDRARDAATGIVTRRDPGDLGDLAGGVASSAAGRGGGAAGAGLLAQLAGVGAAGKAALICLGGGLAATACVAAGVAPFGLDRVLTSRAPNPPAAQHREPAHHDRTGALTVETLPSQVGSEAPQAAPSAGHQVDVTPAAAANEKPAESQASPVAEATPAVEQEFGVAAAAVPAQPAAPAGGSTSGGSGGAGESVVQQEFGP